MYTIYNIGDNALMIDFGQELSVTTNEFVIYIDQIIKNRSIVGILDSVLSYSSLSFMYDPKTLRLNSFAKGSSNLFQSFSDYISELIHELDRIVLNRTTKKITVPVCYDDPYALDMNLVLQKTGLTKNELVALHTNTIFRIFMIGFLPGFPYMGILDKSMFTERKSQPTITPRGSIALAGLQTGIYPMHSPGGWNVIGRTPISIFNAASPLPVPWEAGDEVVFEPITVNQFIELEKKHSHGY